MAFPSFLFIGLSLLVLLVIGGRGVLAQDGTNDALFNSLLEGLDNLGFTNFTAVARQVTSDPQEITFALTLVDTTSPKTLFVPNNGAFANPSVNLNGRTYDPNDNTLLSALLLYHLLPGNWSQDSPDFTSRIDYPVPTTLNGHNVTNLESGTHQVMSCSRGADNTFIVNNQAQTPKIVAAYSTSYLIIYEVDAIIGFPPSYSVLTSSLGLNGVDALRAAASVSSLDSAEGYTLFAPQDAAFGFGISPSNITDPAKVWSNHIIMGRTVYSTKFTSQVFTSASGFRYTLDGSGTKVTLNGVTANIVRTDALTDNGVVHVIDAVLWNTTSSMTVSGGVASASTSTPTSTPASTDGGSAASSGTPIPSSGAATPASNAATLSPGAIVGIVALGMAVLALPLIVVLIRRYRRAYPDDSEDAIKVRRHHSGRRSVFEPPTPVPFRAWYSTPTPEESFPLKATNHSSQASSAAPPLARGSRDKASDQFVLRVSNDPGDAPDPMPMLAPEVVDHIVHQVSQRIDPADGLRALPPSAYPPSYRSRSSMPARVRARRTMG